VSAVGCQIKRGWIMRKQKAKKRGIAPPVIITEQPLGYKKVLKEKEESRNKLRDIGDAIKYFDIRY
jgi:hypothetical protein